MMNTILKIVLVEDEPISIAYLKKMLVQTNINHEIIAELDSITDAMLFFGKQPDYDLVFMDIHLGDGTCFELLNAKVIEKPIIFCTTFDNYAIEAFKYNSIAYLLKPVDLEEVKGAVEKFMLMQSKEESSYLQRMDTMLSNLKEPKHKKRFLVKKNNRLEIIETQQIEYFFSEAGQTYVVDSKNEKNLIDFTLEKLEELLDPEMFFRINRKATLNIDYINAVEDYVNNRLKVEMKLENSFDFIVSRNRVKDFKSWLQGIA